MANEKSKLNYTEGQLHDMVNAYYEEETLYITIEVTSKNKKDIPYILCFLLPREKR